MAKSPKGLLHVAAPDLDSNVVDGPRMTASCLWGGLGEEQSVWNLYRGTLCLATKGTAGGWWGANIHTHSLDARSSRGQRRSMHRDGRRVT